MFWSPSNRHLSKTSKSPEGVASWQDGMGQRTDDRYGSWAFWLIILAQPCINTRDFLNKAKLSLILCVPLERGDPTFSWHYLQQLSPANIYFRSKHLFRVNVEPSYKPNTSNHLTHKLFLICLCIPLPTNIIIWGSFFLILPSFPHFLFIKKKKRLLSKQPLVSPFCQ